MELDFFTFQKFPNCMRVVLYFITFLSLWIAFHFPAYLTAFGVTHLLHERLDRQGLCVRCARVGDRVCSNTSSIAYP